MRTVLHSQFIERSDRLLGCILREAYSHPDFKWVDDCFNNILNEVDKDQDEELELTQEEYNKWNPFKGKCDLEVENESGIGSASIRGGYWNANKKIPVCKISKDFLKNFRKGSDYFIQCKNAFKSFIAHELTHKDQNKVLDIEDNIGVFDITDYYDGEDEQKYMMQYHEFDAHCRSLAQSFLDYGLSKKDALKKLQTPSEIIPILENFKKTNKKAAIILAGFLKRRKNYSLWNKFLSKIYDYYFNDSN